MAGVTGRRAAAAQPGDVKAATRVLDLLELLGPWRRAMTHTELADALEIPKSSLTHLLRTLVARGYLRPVPPGRGYELGPALAALAGRARDAADIVALAAEVLAGVTAETGETSALNLLRGDLSEVAACVMSPRRLLYNMRQGDTAPLYATSGGKALLAFLPPAQLAEYLARVRFEQITPRTLDSPAALAEDLARVRACGTAFVVEEFTPGIAGVARPVLDPAGHALASVNVAVPVARFDPAARDLCIAALARAAETLARRLAEGARRGG